MESFKSLKNLKEHINEYYSESVFHPSLKMVLTVQTMSRKAYDELNEITSPNPFKEGFIILSPLEEKLECDVIYMAYGIKEFSDLPDDKGKEIARGILNKEGFGESNALVLKEIKKVNVPYNEKVKDIILILAFSQRELKVIHSLIESGCKKELAQYISPQEEIVEAFDFCQELFEAYAYIVAVLMKFEITIEYAAMLLAKDIFIERGYTLPEQLENVETPESKKPNVNVNTEQ